MVLEKWILHVNIRVEMESWAGVGRARVTEFEHKLRICIDNR